MFNTSNVWSRMRVLVYYYNRWPLLVFLRFEVWKTNTGLNWSTVCPCVVNRIKHARRKAFKVLNVDYCFREEYFFCPASISNWIYAAILILGI